MARDCAIGSGGDRWNFACRIKGESKPLATAFYSGPWGNWNLFCALSGAIAHFFKTGKAPYPVERTLLVSTAYRLDATRRAIVLRSFIETCRFRGWRLMAAHIRENHVHVIVDSSASAEEVMNALKAYASRALNRLGIDSTDQKRWARHGSTRHLWNHEQISAAITYVLDKQGERMAVYDCEVDEGPSAP